jgi:hypothetical protein
LPDRGEWTPGVAAMERNFRTLRPKEAPDSAFVQSEAGRTILPVVRDGRLVSLLTAENIGEPLMIRTARAQFPAVTPPWPKGRPIPAFTMKTRDPAPAETDAAGYCTHRTHLITAGRRFIPLS